MRAGFNWYAEEYIVLFPFIVSIMCLNGKKERGLEGMDSYEFLESIRNGQINRDLSIIDRMQRKNLDIITIAAKECLNNLGKIYDEIKTKDVRESLEKEMNRLGSTIMENEKEMERLDGIINGKDSN